MFAKSGEKLLGGGGAEGTDQLVTLQTKNSLEWMKRICEADNVLRQGDELRERKRNAVKLGKKRKSFYVLYCTLSNLVYFSFV